MSLIFNTKMKISIKPNSQRKENGKWMPVADIYIHEGEKTRCLGWKWEGKELETKEKADFVARVFSKQKLRREGYLKEKQIRTSSTRES